jgi:hypothetical protein
MRLASQISREGKQNAMKRISPTPHRTVIIQIDLCFGESKARSNELLSLLDAL